MILYCCKQDNDECEKFSSPFFSHSDPTMQNKLLKKFNLKDRISAKQFKEFENRYETFSEIPLISGGFIANNNNNNSLSTVHIIKSQKNIRQKVNREYLESCVCTKQ